MPIDITLLETATTKLITKGVSLVEIIHDRTEANPDADLLDAAKAFEQVSRGTRKAILLAKALAAPPRQVAARKQIIRTVEDNIQRHAEDEDEVETLQAELLDRLDTLDLAEDLADRPVEAIITDILRDFGLAHIRGAHHPWKRRTPADIDELHARAAGLCPAPTKGQSSFGNLMNRCPEDDYPLVGVQGAKPLGAIRQKPPD
jgi:hypothetical protein